MSLQLEDLRKCYDEHEIDAALKSIPHDIEDAYLRKLQSIARKDVHRLSRIFYWISVAMRQLTTFELVAAPGVNLSSPEELSEICPSGMIRLEEQKPPDMDDPDLPEQEAQKWSGTNPEIVTFDHPSVKRFLYSRILQQSSDDRIRPFFVSENTVNAEFASLMIDHLLAIKQPRMESSIFTKSPFLPYAAQYWHEHLRAVPGEDEVLNGKLLTLFADPMNPAYVNWIRVCNPENEMQDLELAQDSCPSPLYVAVFLGFDGISKHLVDNRSYINGVGGLRNTTVQLAAQRGYTEILQELIAAGEDVDKTADDQRTALWIAVEYGNAEIVQTLLAGGANPDAKCVPFGPALQLASFRGVTKIVESLLTSGADVNLQSGRFGTALQAAAEAGHSEIVDTLLEWGAKPDVVGGLLGTAIQAAATGGHAEIVKMLAAKDVAWDEERDSTWRDAYHLWRSKSSERRIVESFLSEELLGEFGIQRMLVAVLKVFSSLSAESIRKAMEAIGKRGGHPQLDAIVANSLKLVDQIRRQGQEGIESGHYVYRALFWAMLFRCTALVSRWQLRFVDVLTAGRAWDLDPDILKAWHQNNSPSRTCYTSLASSLPCGPQTRRR